MVEIFALCRVAMLLHYTALLYGARMATLESFGASTTEEVQLSPPRPPSSSFDFDRHYDGDDDSEFESLRSVNSTSSHDFYDDSVWSLGHSSTSTITTSYAHDNMLSDIGLTAGRVLYVVGKIELDVIGWLWMHYRRVAINLSLSRQVGHFRRGIERMLDDLIEFNQ